MEKKNSRITKFLPVALAVIVISIFTLFMPTGDYIESPGTASKVSDIITVDGQHDQQSGSFRMTTVYLSNARVFNKVFGTFDHHSTLESKESIQGDGSSKDYDKVSDFMMANSFIAAQIVAYQAADKQIDINYNGIYVSSVDSKSNFVKKLKVGDTISAIDGQAFDSSENLIDYLSTKNDGDEITITYNRDGKEKQVTGKTIPIENSESEQYPNGRVGIGIGFIDDISVIANPPTEINSEGYGGPSAGLMFSLQIYNQLTNSGLTNGQIIAGTGEIDRDGNVSEIGGVDKKVIAANNAGAKIFFVPYVEATEERQDTNYLVATATAKEYAKDLKIVPVRNFQDALNYLENGEIIDTK